jgi:hypothetical protein
MTVKAASFLAAILLVAGPAQAHPEFSAAGTNRYVTATVFHGRVDVTDARLEGALTSAEERRRLDTDGDGNVSEAERLAGEALLRAAGPDVGVELDGQPIAASLEVAIDLGGDAKVAAPALVVERRQSFPAAWPPGEHRLRIALAREPKRLLDTELGAVLLPGLTLTSPTDRVNFKGPRRSALEDRSATFTIKKSSPPPNAPVAVPVAVLVAVAVLVLVAVLAFVRRRRRSA